jgi:ferredoxin--NADP+ reductase
MSIRVAIVGAGPAGFYAADRLLRSGQDVTVELLDRLPTPWGLVRAGVAPDHPNIKAVSRVYEKTAALEGFHFHGNVEVGKEITHADLLAHHHAVIYAHGASNDRRLGIPGEELPGVVGATDFVSWYNGHPDAAELRIDLSGKRAVVVGNGNVALDVARMLTAPVAALAKTDIADHALAVLERSRIREVVVLGRRGPEQAAFTNPELLELAELTEADVIVDPADLDVPEAQPDPTATTTARRNVEILRDYASRPPSGRPKRIVFRFLASPVELLGAERVEAITIVRNELVAGDDGSLRSRPTDARETIAAGLLLRAIGYRGTPLEGVPFDERAGVIVNERGRVRDRPGEYAVGWVKRGPTGVIGTNKKDAQETVDVLLEDLAAGRLPERPPIDDTYEGWEMIDRHERELGEPAGRPRVKLTSVDDMVEVAESRLTKR